MLDFKLFAIGDRRLVPDLPEFVNRATAAGLRTFQIREKDLSPRALFDLTISIRAAASSCKLFINERADIAIAAGADGVHLPEVSWPPTRLSQIFSSLEYGVSVHSVDGAIRAADEGANFIVFGPVFDTPSKRAIGFGGQGLEALKHISQSVSIPIFAIGGITPERARQCVEQGAWGVATIGDLLTAPNLAERLGEYKEALGSL